MEDGIRAPTVAKNITLPIAQDSKANSTGADVLLGDVTMLLLSSPAAAGAIRDWKLDNQS